MSWRHHLDGWVTIDQNTRDPGSPDASVNCGPAATAAIGRWLTGRHFDPEELRIGAGDPTGINSGTGPEIDRWFFGSDGPVHSDLRIRQPGSEDALAYQVWRALMHGHAAKILQVYDAPDSEWHWRVIHASWESRGTRFYGLGDPWTGETVVQSRDLMYAMLRGPLLIVPLRSR